MTIVFVANIAAFVGKSHGFYERAARNDDVSVVDCFTRMSSEGCGVRALTCLAEDSIGATNRTKSRRFTDRFGFRGEHNKENVRMAKKPAKKTVKKPAKKVAAAKKTTKPAKKAAPKKASASKSAGATSTKTRSIAKPRNTSTLSYSQSEFVENVRAFCGLDKRSEARQLIEDIALFVTESLRKGYKIPLMGLGKLYVRETKARQGRNPATGEVIQIPKRKRVKFTPAKALKEQVLK